jgi:hypothetical protein
VKFSSSNNDFFFIGDDSSLSSSNDVEILMPWTSNYISCCNVHFLLLVHEILLNAKQIGGRHESISGLRGESSRYVNHNASDSKLVQDLNQFHIG